MSKTGPRVWVRTVVLASVVVVAGAAAATAEPLRINSGFFTIGGSFGVDLHLDATDPRTHATLSVTGEGNGTPPPEFASFFCTTCSPPSTLPVFNVSFAGVNDPTSNSSCPGCSYSGNFTFRSPSRPIPNGDDAVTAPFTMSGTFQAFSPSANALVFNGALGGAGSVVAQRNLLVYQFASAVAPTPEPASALLLLTGAGLAAQRFRKRRVIA